MRYRLIAIGLVSAITVAGTASAHPGAGSFPFPGGGHTQGTFPGTGATGGTFPGGAGVHSSGVTPGVFPGAGHTQGVFPGAGATGGVFPGGVGANPTTPDPEDATDSPETDTDGN